jgi:hypothetical protein
MHFSTVSQRTPISFSFAATASRLHADTMRNIMADINVEYFYHDIAKILSNLYSSFPSKAAIFVDEVSGVDEPDEYGLHNNRYTACFYAMLWLQEEGYLRYSDTIRQDGIDQATLTQKAFMRLSAVADPIYTDPVGEAEDESEPDEDGLSPSVLEDRMLVVNQLCRALAARSSIAISKVVQHILT